MSWALSLAIRALPAILSLIGRIFAAARDRGLLEAGAARERAAQLQKITETLKRAGEAETAARARHVTDDTDDAFDLDFKREE